MATPSPVLKERYYPTVPLRQPLSGRQGFYDCDKARRLLGWQHDQ
jgi:UDP-glucose 4-epimerase